MFTVSVRDVVPPEVVAKDAPPEVDVRLTATGVVVGLPNASCSCTVIAFVALEEAVPLLMAEVEKTSSAGGAGLTETLEGATNAVGTPFVVRFGSNASKV
jgi:uncharacterized membrane protein YraQ (UPF0718 family)